MGYCTVADVRIALVPDLDIPANPPENQSLTGADLPNDQIQNEIDEACQQIDTYINARYVTPAVLIDDGTASIPPVLVGPSPLRFWARNIACYNATLTYRKGQDIEDTDPVVRRWKATMDALKLVQSGGATLPLPPNSGDSGASGAGSPINPYFGNLFDAAQLDLGYGLERERGHWSWSGGW